MFITVDKVNNLKTTNDFAEAGFITPEGKMLDLSGGAEGKRNVQHKDAVGGSDALKEFINLGNIRLMPESNGIQIAQRPTYEQKIILKHFFEMNDGEIIVELNDGIGEYKPDEMSYGKPETRFLQFDRGENPSKILGEIERFFNNPADFQSGSLFQPGETPRGKVDFNQGKAIITLFEKADASTALHELHLLQLGIRQLDYLQMLLKIL